MHRRRRGPAMNRVRNRSLWRWIIPPIGDLVIFYLGLATTLMVRQPNAATALTAMTFLPLFVAWLMASYTVGLYELRLMRDDVALVRNILISGAACMVMGTVYFYLLGQHTSVTPKTDLVVTVAVSHALLFAWRRVWLWLLNFDIMDQRVVFLGAQEHLAALAKGLPHHAPDSGLSVVSWDSPVIDVVVADAPWVDRNWGAARDILLGAMARGIPIVSLEDFYESIFGKVSPYYAANPSWAIEHILPKYGDLYMTVKRAIDFVGAAALLVVCAPVLAATAAVIAILDGRPVFFKQERAGLLGKPFILWKFRTMSQGADRKGPLLAADALDSHITALGAFLRRFRFDELPQLWNVLKGDLSFVGPRPEWIKEVEVLEKVVQSNHLRHLVKPGVTGWAQVKFRQTNTVADTVERLHYDLYYVKYLSFGLDVSIVLKTIKRVLISDSSVAAPAMAVMPLPADARWVIDLTRRLGRPRVPEPSLG
ncbi:MAG: sugar transferase [Elusimicrobia bacterium]|nr:sugar transferase [Elusimicrobiota bacterium]